MPTTRVIPVDPEEPSPGVIAEAAGVLRSGGLVAFATETVYGLGADATHPGAVARIFQAKGRPSTNPLIVHLADKSDAPACVADWPGRADRLADRFWPGPLTLVLPRSGIIPDIVTAGQDTVGVRVPRPGVARWLIFESRRPIAAPSANRSNGVSPTRAEHVLQDLDGEVDLILDSGPTSVGIESTVLDLTGEFPNVLRPGPVTLEEIVAVLDGYVGNVGGIIQGEEAPRSPGQLAVHYAPRTPAYRVERGRIPRLPVDARPAVLILGPLYDLPVKLTGPGSDVRWDCLADPDTAAARLYTHLREIDEGGFESLLVILPPLEPRWRAVRDRIWRATQPWPNSPR